LICIIKEQWSDQEESKSKREKGCQIKWLHIVDTPVAR
jgi:hypothetical protein